MNKVLMKYPLTYDPQRPVGAESRKTYAAKIESGFFARYMQGHGAEIGFAGYIEGCVPILENCDGFELGMPGYDGVHLPYHDGEIDYVYSSHCLEHIYNWVPVIQEWFRVIRPNGHIITVVPHRDLYEKKMDLPSRFNADHKRFFTSHSLIAEFGHALPHNSFRIVHLCENDAGHDYHQAPEEHSLGQYEIEIVIRKIEQ
jgi:SAM-dependent methyltransferase